METHVHLQSPSQNSCPHLLSDGRAVPTDPQDVPEPDRLGNALLSLGRERAQEKGEQEGRESRDELEQTGEEQVVSRVDEASRERGGRRGRKELLEVGF